MESSPVPAPSRGPGAAVVAGLAVVALLAAAVAGVALTRDGQIDREAPQGEAPAVALDSTPVADEPVPFDERVAPDERAPLPARTLEGFGADAPVDLAEYRGRPLVVNFWATWCAPCVDEMPAFQQVFSELGDEVGFLGVDVADAARAAEPFVAELGIGYDLARDPERTFAQEVGVFAMPTTLFVDAEGTIVHRSAGGLTGYELRQALRLHLAAAA